ncbi:cupin-like domain-containing protein [Winogradskyella sp. F6397]|uniref:Cupin-like domain-containing protein n=1 Tax=Winogradskyella marina TaxID=2785530 RepID=A0ABS0EJ44_9FLAO|nr:cupin-like domain-containing protein [Winogradskyella marina]MBF8150475.1 cupin-like domain-containing protein [Winogradskyella marina]
MKSRANISKIDRCNGLSQKAFYNKYVKTSLPVVITDKAEWTSSEKFTIDYLKSNYNHLSKTIDGKTYSLSEIIDLCQTSTPENKAPYPNTYDALRDFPENFGDLPEILYGKSNRLNSRLLSNFFAKHTNQHELFFGGYGCSFPTVHFDWLGVHSQITQIIGKKDVILYSPDQTPYFYPDKRHHHHSPVNILNPDYDKFPLFKNAKAVKTTLNPGETLFIPAGWWHTTYMHDFNLTVAISHVNSYNWNFFMDELYLNTKIHYPKLAWMVKIYKVVVGKIFNVKEALVN